MGRGEEKCLEPPIAAAILTRANNRRTTVTAGLQKGFSEVCFSVGIVSFKRQNKDKVKNTPEVCCYLGACSKSKP